MVSRPNGEETMNATETIYAMTYDYQADGNEVHVFEDRDDALAAMARIIDDEHMGTEYEPELLEGCLKELQDVRDGKTGTVYITGGNSVTLREQRIVPSSKKVLAT